MITKNDLQKMFNENEGHIFTIKTNIANGHGLNGISYDSITSHQRFLYGGEIVNCVEQKIYESSKEYTYRVVEINESMLVLDKVYVYTKFDKYEKKGQIEKQTTYHSKIYLPFDSIQSIEFELE